MEVFEVESRARARINAEVAKVLSIDVEHRRAQVLTKGSAQTLDLDGEMHWEHAYTSTVHAAQGRTADRVLLHLDTSTPQLLGHESWYVAISRARSELRIFTDRADRLPDVIRRTLQQESAIEVVAPAKAPPSPDTSARERSREHVRGGFEFGFLSADRSQLSPGYGWIRWVIRSST